MSDRKLKNRKYATEQRLRKKMAVVRAYGGCCSCCGESTIEFLCIDHIHNDGAEHREVIGMGKTTDGRRKVGSGSIIIKWLIKNNYPDGFQLLCANCNMAKGSYGVCPHARDRGSVVEPDVANVKTRVRFSSVAPKLFEDSE